jgi:hypothetical protein
VLRKRVKLVIKDYMEVTRATRLKEKPRIVEFDYMEVTRASRPKEKRIDGFDYTGYMDREESQRALFRQDVPVHVHGLRDVKRFLLKFWSWTAIAHQCIRNRPPLDAESTAHRQV